MTTRTPLEILDVIDQAQNDLDIVCPGDYDLRSLVWEVIADVSASYELAMQFLGGNIVGEINNTVGDYLAAHYGDDGDDEADPEQAERDARTDLCEQCKPIEHDTCSLDANCACCRTTITAMDEEG